MPNQWSGRIAGQSAHFRGTSFVGIKAQAPEFPNTKSLAGAVYVARVTGGVSGSFSVHVLGMIGKHGTAALPNSDISNVGTTVCIAGVTGVAAAGTYILVPYGYSANGVPVLADAAVGMHTIDEVVPPALVAFEPTTGAAVGISAHVLVSACLWVG